MNQSINRIRLKRRESKTETTKYKIWKAFERRPNPNTRGRGTIIRFVEVVFAFFFMITVRFP